MSDMPPNRDQQGSNRPPGPPMRMSRGVISWVVFIIFSLMLVMMVMSSMTSRTKLSMDAFRKELETNNIEKVVLQSDRIVGELKEVSGQNQSKHFEVDWPTQAIDSRFVDYVLSHCKEAEVITDNNSGLFFQILINIVPWILVFAFI